MDKANNHSGENKETALRQSRRGFTLIELLVVIGIILVLMSIVVVGFRHLNATTARRETIAELHIARDLLQEYENTNRGSNGAISNIEEPGKVQVPGPAGPGAPPAPDVFPVYLDEPPKPGSRTLPQKSKVEWADLFPNGAPSTTTPDMGDKSIQNSARYSAPAVQKTQDVMYLLLRDPKNRTTVSNVPPKRIMESAPNVSTPQGPNDISHAVLLDGWANPIIFVPAGGLVVNIPDASGKPLYYVVRSTGPIVLGASPTNQPPPPTLADRPFWASAGQDGDFTQGADNVYSFQD